MRGYLTRAEIDIGALRHNYRVIDKAAMDSGVMAVVKADGYGHGAVEASKAFIEEGVPYLAVAFVGEGVELREEGIDTPILVFARPVKASIGLQLENSLDVTISHSDDVEFVSKAAEYSGINARVHLNIDSGMCRYGVPFDEAISTAEMISFASRLEFVGIYSHLAASDEVDAEFTKVQLARFTEVIEALDQKGLTPPLRHLANSGGIIHHDDTHFNMVRAGISLYGHHPDPRRQDEIDLIQVMTLKSVITQIREIEAGTSVGYGRTWISSTATKIAVIPAGYADGINRQLSNNMEVLINGSRFPVVGRVCMDMMMIDVGDAPVTEGEEVVIYGRQGDEMIRIAEIAKRLKTISYEITCAVSARVQRVYINR